MADVRIFRRAVFLLAVVVAHLADASQLDKKQNPGFITVLPTSVSTSIVVITTPVPAIPSVQPSLPTPVPTIPLVIPSTPSSIPSASPSPIAEQSASVVGAVQGPYSGGIPSSSPDVALAIVFVNLFFLGTVIHAMEFRQNCRRSKTGWRDTLSGLIACFCLARVATCVLRLVWLGLDSSVPVIFLEQVFDNAGTCILFFLNYRMARRMISFYNIRLSLWARTVVDSTTRNSVLASVAVAFALNTTGVALFILHGSTAQETLIAAHLVQAGAAVLLALGLSFLGVVALLRFFADHPKAAHCRVKTIVFFTGAGVLTMSSHLVRTATTFFVWKPLDPASAVVLSKIVYYSTGFGIEVLIVALYTVMKVDLLFSRRLWRTWAPQPKIFDFPGVGGGESKELELSSDGKEADVEESRYGAWASVTHDDKHGEVVESVAEKSSSKDGEEILVPHHQQKQSESEAHSGAMAIKIHTTFSVSSTSCRPTSGDHKHNDSE